MLLVCCIAVLAQEFELPLDIKGAHVAQIFLACQKGATGGYDKGKDIYIPPAAFQTGHIGICTQKKDGLYLYKDVRDASLPQEWAIACTPNVSMTLSWKREALPKSVSFTIKAGQGQPLDMGKYAQITVKKKCHGHVLM